MYRSMHIAKHLWKEVNFWRTFKIVYDSVNLYVVPVLHCPMMMMDLKRTFWSIYLWFSANQKR